MKVLSFKEASILRKFTIFFILMSILPLSVLYYVYSQMTEKGIVEITSDNLNFVLIFIVIGVALGFWGMRAVILDLINMTKSSSRKIKDILGNDQIKEVNENEDEIATLTESFNVVIDRLKENIRNLELAKRTLHSVLAKVGNGIASMENIDTFLDLILETFAESLGSSKAILFLTDDEGAHLIVRAMHGSSQPLDRNIKIRFDQGSFKTLVKAEKPMIIEKIECDDLPDRLKENLFEEPLLCAPLVLHEKLLGAIVISKKEDGKPFVKDELNLLNNVALQTAVAIENSKLNQDAEKTYFETISALALAVEAKDLYSRGHLDRVSDYAAKIAKRLNLSNHDVAILRDAARLHDVGKIGVYDDVLRKPGRLTPEERQMISKHPEVGESIIKPIHSLRPLCDIVRHHHERLDGSGYPDGLKGEEISLLARILMVADIYDALTTDRPYRRALANEEAKQILMDMNDKIDMNVVKTLFEAL
ncbi:MAG: HD domain-containing phosphohydrolase [Candidatus Omnitrophota bacterium]